MDKKRFEILLLISVLLIATCGLIYELVAGTLASYLLGDSVTQFSTIIGTYLFAMGIGSYVSRFIQGDLLKWFIRIELLVGVIGGFSSIALFAAFQYLESFRFLLYALVTLTGTFVGLEIPILMRIFNEQKVEFKDLVSRVFTFDYLGALIASLVFPLILVPKLGLVRTSLLFGMMNTGMALFFILKIQHEKKYTLLKMSSWLVFLLMAVTFSFAERIQNSLEQESYRDEVIIAKNSPYQRIVLTVGKELRLYLNGNLQFSSLDEYRYHESLVHPVMLSAQSPKHVLILGGGDGLALREVLKYPDVEQVTLVDLDPELTKLFSEYPLLTELNANAFSNPKVNLVHADAFAWIRNASNEYDAIIIDFPDPSSYGLGKLYTQTFYKNLSRIMHNGSAAVVQSTSPFYAPNSYWCIEKTIASCGFQTQPYHCLVPSFGEWGYILASKGSTTWNAERIPDSLRFFSPSDFKVLREFPKDMAKREVEVNKLNNQSLVTYFEQEWKIIN